MANILKISRNNEKNEIDFELEYLMSLTISQRFYMMFEKSRQMIKMLKNNGYRTVNKIIKRK